MTTLKILALCSAIGAAGLSGCHSNSNDSSSPAQPNTPNGQVTLSGTAATGAALKDATITANCKNNTGFNQPVKTDNNGKWSGQVAAASLPCALQAKTADIALHSYATAAGNINITPFTDLTLALATRQKPADWFKNYQALLETQLKTAINQLRDQLASKNYKLPEEFNLFSTSFNVGDAFDKVLDAFNAALAASTTNIKNYNSLLEQVLTSGSVNSIPAALAVTNPGSPTTQTCAGKKLPVTTLSSIADYTGNYQDKGKTVFSLNTQAASLSANGITATISEVCGPNVQNNGTKSCTFD